MPAAHEKVIASNSGGPATQRRSDFANLRFYGDEFVFNVVSGAFYSLTPTAAMLLRLVQGGCDVDQLAEKLQSEFGASHQSALRDVELFLNDLKYLGISDLPTVQPSKRRDA